MARISLDTLVNRVEEIPVFPPVVNKILRLTEDPASSAADIENEILMDQALTVKVLKLANSAYFGGARNVKTVKQAIVLLGFQAIKTLVLATTMRQFLDTPLPGYALEQKALWENAQTSALIARLIAKKIGYPKPELAYTAALIKDVGKIVMDIYLREDYLAIIDRVNKGNEPFIQVEEEVLGYHHGQVGAKIAQKWRLPLDLVEAIALHHQPDKAIVNPALIAITHVADGLVMMMGIHLGVDGLAYVLSDKAVSLLKVSEETLMEIMAEVSTIIEEGQ